MGKKIRIIYVLLVLLFISASLEGQVNGVIIEQDLDASSYGYTIIQLWGSHYEMGYAYGYLMGDDIASAIEEAKVLVTTWGYTWNDIILLVNSYTYKPDCIEDEFDGIADGVNDTVPGGTYTASDVKGINLFGDIAYAIGCRSVSSWGSTVSNSEFTTISTRRLDYGDVGLDAQYHHVIAKFEPDDSTPNWINFAWPGYVACVTGVNEFGTTASLHDWGTMGYSPPNPLPRVIACRYALTMVTDPDVSTHRDSVFAELNRYGAATPGFLNYYVPGGGGVIKHRCEDGYYELRTPHPDCYGGEAIYTNNSNISGATIGEPWSTYYSTYAPTGDITMNGQWTSAGPSFHRVTVGVRARDDMVVWFDGYTPHGLTPKVELEWTALEIVQHGNGTTLVNYEILTYPNPFNSSVNIRIQSRLLSGKEAGIQGVEIFDINGRLVLRSPLTHLTKGGKEESVYSQEVPPLVRGVRGDLLWTPETSLSSGIYFIRANIGKQQVCKKIVYLK